MTGLRLAFSNPPPPLVRTSLYAPVSTGFGDAIGVRTIHCLGARQASCENGNAFIGLIESESSELCRKRMDSCRSSTPRTSNLAGMKGVRAWQQNTWYARGVGAGILVRHDVRQDQIHRRSDASCFLACHSHLAMGQLGHGVRIWLAGAAISFCGCTAGFCSPSLLVVHRTGGL